MNMQLRATATLGEKTIRTYQNAHGMCILEIDGLFLIGWADANANLVLPAELAAVKTFDTAAYICDEAGKRMDREKDEEKDREKEEQASADPTPLNDRLDEQRRLRGICSIPTCDKPIAGWCSQCPHPPKLCRGHLMAHCASHNHWPFYSIPTGRL